jgi:asparagine synthase (glutamine-hydrolysing)
VAEFIGASHHEVIVTFDQMLAALPDVIYHLESFDALLVRSSITNYLVAQLAGDYVAQVFSGEGGDELFAGYDYLKALPPAQLSKELLDITHSLHNTALQRVDRCAAAHGTRAHVCFLAPPVLDYALRIPVELKLHNGVEKWILRQAMHDLLPVSVLMRTKAKFWEGAGVGDLLAHYAGGAIGDAEFRRERTLPNGWQVNSKEELLYYRIFREQFGQATDLSWMGRTKGSPVQF